MFFRRSMVALVLTLGCGTGGGGETPDPTPTAQPLPPTVSLTAPGESGSYKVERPVELLASFQDPDSALDSLSVEWTSSLEGVIASGNPNAEGLFVGSHTFTVTGTHQITVKATDPSGASGSVRANISLGALAPPEVTLDGAPSGLQEGEQATVTGVVTDAEDTASDLLVRWRLDGVSVQVDTPGLGGGISFTTDPLDSGLHTVTAEATDTDGFTATGRIDFNVATCPDSDRDGYKACGTSSDIDCDDRDPDVNPGERELCGEIGETPIDEDCDGDIDEGFEDSDRDLTPDCRDVCPFDRQDDRDGDGICGDVDNCPGEANPDQLDADQDDIGDACDDEIREVCDGVDNDLDGFIDEGFDSDADLDGVIDCLDSCPGDAEDDIDSDGYCADEDNCPFDSNPDQLDDNMNGVGDACENETCDGRDNDSDGLVDEDFDADGDGYPTCQVGGTEPDCDDNDPDSYPGPEEICDDEQDNNCDGLIDGQLDEYEPNNSIADVYSFGNRNDSEFRVFPTLFSGTGVGDSDWFQVIVDDDFAVGQDKFTFIAEITGIPEGIDVGLYLWYDPDAYLSGTCGELEIVASTANPGGRTQTVQRKGSSGPDDDVCPYFIEVRYLGGDITACEPYELWVFNEG